MRLLRCASAVVAAAIAWSSSAAYAQSSSSSKADASLLPYMDLSHSVKLGDGRRIHFTCMGRGSPTVILSAGAGEWGVTWNKVQPEIAKKTQVCTWDRAGFGFSDGSPAKQTIIATTNDLSAALSRSGLRAPYVMVGHSLAGLELLLLADRRPRQFAGMVLVDPSIPDQEKQFAAAAPAVAASNPAYFSKLIAGLRGCSDAIRSGKVASGTLDPRCLRYPPNYPAAVSVALAKADSNPARFATEASFFESVSEDFTLAVNPRRKLGSMPIIILTATEQPPFPPGTPAELVAQYPAAMAVIRKGHDAIAALSTRGVNRLVPGTTHFIQQIKPDVVIAAVEEIVDTARAA
ncbi:MAG: alpha/beta hydrolase, partial [Alphaproteobacteria bacterium]|nr:alpha/beta hydrolase [Alphaproteobacteria bacterium]